MSAAEAQKALDAGAEALLAEAATFRYDVVLTIETGSITQAMVGSYDGPRKIWQATQTFSAEPPELLEGGPLPAASFIGMVGKAYIGFDEWLRKEGGKWRVLTGEQLAGGGAGVGEAFAGGLQEGVPLPIYALMQPEAVSAKRTDNGVVVQGSVTGYDALSLLQLVSPLAKSGIDASTVDGRARVTVELDARGRPVNLVLDGADADLDTHNFPEAIRMGLPMKRAEVSVEDFDADVSISIPAPSETIPWPPQPR